MGIAVRARRYGMPPVFIEGYCSSFRCTRPRAEFAAEYNVPRFVEVTMSIAPSLSPNEIRQSMRAKDLCNAV
jgi:hypothetical protein